MRGGQLDPPRPLQPLNRAAADVAPGVSGVEGADLGVEGRPATSAATGRGVEGAGFRGLRAEAGNAGGQWPGVSGVEGAG